MQTEYFGFTFGTDWAPSAIFSNSIMASHSYAGQIVFCIYDFQGSLHGILYIVIVHTNNVLRDQEVNFCFNRLVLFFQ